MRVLTCAPSDDLRRLRHLVAAAIERLRALPLPPGDPAAAGEIACIALGALSTALFVGAEGSTARLPLALVEDELGRIAALLGLPWDTPVQSAAAPRTGLPASAVSP